MTTHHKTVLTMFLAAVATTTTAFAIPLSPGDLDPSFGGSGFVTTSIGTTDLASSAALQTDGKLVVAGQADQDSVLARYDVTGTLDASFGSGGTARAVVPWPIARVAVDADSRIVALRADDLGLARLLPNGTLDPAFGTGGLVASSLSTPMMSANLALQADGRILVVGSIALPRSSLVLARYLSDGTPDRTFGFNGTVVSELESPIGTASAVALSADRKILVTGALGGATAGGFVVRYLPDGRLDETFATAGIRHLSFAPKAAILIQADGKVIVGAASLLLTRLDLDGSTDPTFADGGFSLTPLAQGRLAGLALAPEGGFLAGGVSTRANGQQAFTLARYRPDGRPDLGFGDDGIVTTFVGSPFVGNQDDVQALLVQEDGKALLVGTAPAAASGTDLAVARYLGGALAATTTTTSTTLPRACAGDLTVRPRAARRAIIAALHTLRLAQRNARRSSRRPPLSFACSTSVDGAFVSAIDRVSGLLQ